MCTDEYARQLYKQDSGSTCEHCGSTWGHYKVCPLLENKNKQGFRWRIDFRPKK